VHKHHQIATDLGSPEDPVVDPDLGGRYELLAEARLGHGGILGVWVRIG
jgi:hypothetical protein